MLRTVCLMAASPKPPPPPVTFPITNPEIQFLWEAESFSSGLAANTATTSGNRYSNIGVYNQWISDKAVSQSSWTNSNGNPTYYIVMPSDADFCTVANTHNGTDIINNGGFTFWYVSEAWQYGSGWGRIFKYAGFGSGEPDHTSSSRTLGSTGQFSGPLIFQNTGGYIEYRRPSPSTSNGDTANPANELFNSSYIMYLLISQYASGTATYHYYVSDKTTATNYRNYNATFSFSGSAGTGFKSGTDKAKPFFNDSTYWSGGAVNNRMVTFGFANRPYSGAERTTLLTHLRSLYE